jgi:hypothetical protein
MATQQLADSSRPIVVPAATAVAAAKPEVADYMMAHQEYSPSNTMRGVASYIRTVGMQENEMSQ